MNDILNKYRVFPRLFSLFYIYTSYKILIWFFNNPNITAEQSAFLAIYVSGGIAYLKFYTEYRPDSKEEKNK